MRIISLVVCLALTFVGATASAEPTDNVSAWTQRFGQAVLSSNADAITKSIGEIADPRLKTEAMRGAVESGIAAIGTEAPEYVEQFDQRDLGNFAKRVSFAVRYTTNFLFYSVILERDARGWQLVQLNIDGSLEKILQSPWPS